MRFKIDEAEWSAPRKEKQSIWMYVGLFVPHGHEMVRHLFLLKCWLSLRAVLMSSRNRILDL